MAKEEMLACGMEVHRLGEVELVSKTHIFSLNLLPLIGAVWLYGDNQSICPLPCSNYDRECYKQCLYMFLPTAAWTWKSILMGLKTHWHYHHEVSHGVMYKLLMGCSDSALGKGYCGLSR